MTNFEKWKDIILAITNNSDSVAMEGGVLCRCSELNCNQCDFHGMCNKHRYEWLYAEYVEPKVDWSKVAIDTKILVRNSEKEPWVRGYFAGVDEEGKVKSFFGGRTSWTAGNPPATFWSECEDAKLADEGET